MDTNTTINNANHVMANTYSRFPLIFTKGDGCNLWDINGNKYIDFVAGIAVCGIGHSNGYVKNYVCEQLEKIQHVSNLYYNTVQIEAAEWLVQNSFADKVFFCNSGAEANEAAIKLARKFFYDKEQFHKNRIIAMKNSFHGRTYGALSATGQDKIKKGFDPLLEGFDFVALNDIDALKNAINENVCAVMLEPIQGEGGINVCSKEYLNSVREICNENNILLIFDEIQTGMGRTGKLFAYEHFDVIPDIMTLAKALGNGFPIGAALAKEEIIKSFGPGSHATTFGGNAVSTSAAMAVINYFQDYNVVDNCKNIGEYFKDRLGELKKKYDFVLKVKGIGLLLGLELSIKGAPIVEACIEKGFLINCVQEKILRFIPPLIIKKNDIDALINCLNIVFDTIN